MKNDPASIAYSLQEAHAVIASEFKLLENHEQVSLDQALGRINAVTLFADQPEPSYSQSTRDGFALAGQPYSLSSPHTSFAEFQISGEKAAGCTEEQELQPGQAYRIMTGAMLPRHTARVVPFELCLERGSRLSVPQEVLREDQLYIRFQGQNIKQGQRLITAGTQLCPDHLLLLAENGSQQVRVCRRPRVAVICTGNELIKSGEQPLCGQKVSSNEVLLASLLQEQGCCLVRSIRVKDHVKSIVKEIQKILVQDKPDLLISTGGTGSGKFDLIEQAVVCLQGNPLYNLLKIRPGKSTLFARIDGIPLFALPGPPPAVRLLFYELVVSGLDCLQGRAKAKFASSQLEDAVLTEPVRLRRTGYLALKAAKASLCNGKLQARPARPLEPINALMHLACTADKKNMRKEIAKGQQVKVRLLSSLRCLA
ncbi:MAG: molybdopterin molybdenumtransferase MoeA [Candidatus Electrothrix sp. AW3_4]|nr:molybdopterin molybdenumtransferase MoeA [Candidatus Electrothrix gigas]